MIPEFLPVIIVIILIILFVFLIANRKKCNLEEEDEENPDHYELREEIKTILTEQDKNLAKVAK